MFSFALAIVHVHESVLEGYGTAMFAWQACKVKASTIQKEHLDNSED